MASHAFWVNVVGFHVGMLANGVVAVWDTVAVLLVTVTVTVTRSMATVSQTATMPQAALPTWNPVTFTQNAWQATHALARCDLALVAGIRSHWTLHAQLVLFTPLSTADVGGSSDSTGTTTGTTGTTGTTPVSVPTTW